MAAAAKAAGCTVTNPAYEGASHEQKDFAAADYKTNPPTSGNHFPDWYDDGVYEPGTTPNLGMLVHTLEHGRIDVQYKKGTPKADVAKLEALLAEQNDGYHMLLFENTTGMQPQIAATAWTHGLVLPGHERQGRSTRSAPSGPATSTRAPRPSPRPARSRRARAAGRSAPARRRRARPARPGASPSGTG